MLFRSTELTGAVEGVPDGDVLLLRVAGGREYRVRLNGIDAPELQQPYGRKAQELLAGLLRDRPLRVVTLGEDRGGQVIGDVYVSQIIYGVFYELIGRNRRLHIQHRCRLIRDPAPDLLN